MKPPTFARPLIDDERQTLEVGLRQSADGHRPRAIAASVGCRVQPVRNAIRALEAEGLVCFAEKPSRPRATRETSDVDGRRRLRELLHRSPRDVGKPTSLGTLGLAAEVAHAEGLADRPSSGEAILQALARLGVGRERAKTWITGPDPASARKEGLATA